MRAALGTTLVGDRKIFLKRLTANRVGFYDKEIERFLCNHSFPYEELISHIKVSKTSEMCPECINSPSPYEEFRPYSAIDFTISEIPKRTKSEIKKIEMKRKGEDKGEEEEEEEEENKRPKGEVSIEPEVVETDVIEIVTVEARKVLPEWLKACVKKQYSSKYYIRSAYFDSEIPYFLVESDKVFIAPKGYNRQNLPTREEKAPKKQWVLRELTPEEKEQAKERDKIAHTKRIEDEKIWREGILGMIKGKIIWDERTASDLRKSERPDKIVELDIGFGPFWIKREHYWTGSIRSNWEWPYARSGDDYNSFASYFANSKVDDYGTIISTDIIKPGDELTLSRKFEYLEDIKDFPIWDISNIDMREEKIKNPSVDTSNVAFEKFIRKRPELIKYAMYSNVKGSTPAFDKFIQEGRRWSIRFSKLIKK